ncbi:MAG TPA: RCC1 domain-containing protein, partial [Polyangiaceae bacterium]
GQLGYGNMNDIGDNELPSSAGNVNVGGAIVQIVAGSFHTCALLSTRSIRCWGDSTSRQLGYFPSERIGDNELPWTAGDVPLTP